MTPSRLLKMLGAATVFAQNSQTAVNLCGNATHCKEIAVSVGNNTIQLAYSIDFPQGNENMEHYTTDCVTDNTFVHGVTNLKENDEPQNEVNNENATVVALLCNISMLFELQNKAPIVVDTYSNLSSNECDIFENNTWLAIYNCMKHIDQNRGQSNRTDNSTFNEIHQQYNSTDNSTLKQVSLSFGETLGIMAGIGAGIGVLGLFGMCCRGGCNTDTSMRNERESQRVNRGRWPR